jgi:hypothetical protein
MDVAELLVRRSLLVTVAGPGDTVPEFEVGPSTMEGTSIYAVGDGRWALGYTERGIFDEGEIFASEDAACRALWQRMVVTLERDGFALRPLIVADGNLGLRVRTTVNASDLARYAESADRAVRANLAMRTDLPASVLETLASDRSLVVRWRIAANPSTPDLERFIAELAVPLALNPALPAHLVDIVLDSDDPSVRWRIARNPVVPFARLEELARDPEFGVRWGVAANPSTPLSLLESLARDEEFAVRLAVEVRRAAPGERLHAVASRVAAH